MCVALLFSSCTKDTLDVPAIAPNLSTTSLSSTITSDANTDYSNLMIDLEDGLEAANGVSTKYCRCFLRVTGVQGFDETEQDEYWGLTDVTQGNGGLPLTLDLSGNKDGWSDGINGIMPFPSRPYELQPPTNGPHTLLFSFFTNNNNVSPDNYTLNVVVGCGEDKGTGLNFINNYGYDLVFPEGDHDGDPNAIFSYFDFYFSCNQLETSEF